MTEQDIANAIAAKARELAHDNKLVATDVPLINALAAALWSRAPKTITQGKPARDHVLTENVAMELIDHEAIVREWYKDSENVGTWGIGVTNASGHNVDRYKDNPQSIQHVLDVYVWLLRNQYIPDVVKALGDTPLTEPQFAALLAFHYNTGAIGRSDLVGFIRAGEMKKARGFWTSHYLNGGTLQERRNKEAALFFDGVWSHDKLATVYPVRKPSYTPNWGGATQVDISAELAKAIA